MEEIIIRMLSLFLISSYYDYIVIAFSPNSLNQHQGNSVEWQKHDIGGENNLDMIQDPNDCVGANCLPHADAFNQTLWTGI